MSKRKLLRANEICSLLDVRPYVLRFWESEFVEITFDTDPSTGQKIYDDESIRAIKVIKHLLFHEKLSIEKAKGLLLKHSVNDLTLQFFADQLQEQYIAAEQEAEQIIKESDDVIETSENNESEEKSLTGNKIDNFFGQTPFEEVYGIAEAVEEEEPVRPQEEVDDHEIIENVVEDLDDSEYHIDAANMQKLVLAKAKLSSILSSIEGIQNRRNFS